MGLNPGYHLKFDSFVSAQTWIIFCWNSVATLSLLSCLYRSDRKKTNKKVPGRTAMSNINQRVKHSGVHGKKLINFCSLCIRGLKMLYIYDTNRVNERFEINVL